MVNKIESFLFGKVMGRVSARLAGSAISGLAAWLSVQGVNLTPDQQAAAVGVLISAFNGAWTKLSEWREKRAVAAAAPKP